MSVFLASLAAAFIAGWTCNYVLWAYWSEAPETWDHLFENEEEKA